MRTTFGYSNVVLLMLQGLSARKAIYILLLVTII
jgi:hypothetical protein